MRSQSLRSHSLRLALVLGSSLLLAQAAWAQAVQVQGAWARATVQGQLASGAFMRLTAPTDMRLKAVASPVAGVAEVHEMRLEGDVMKMAAVPGGLQLPAGKTVELKPGGYHIMLMDLKQPLRKDSTIPLTLVFVDGKGAESRSELSVPVSAMPPMNASEPGAHMH